ncbi:MAG: hypothetical protein CMK09_08145 [Ponticaulis sp.]|nr:hypothetical protein [Ponticaulis sp.]|tara:strand:- start:30871 stop:31407 length:537 start_codon:yes stop_codon:yes gene_type:complete
MNNIHLTDFFFASLATYALLGLSPPAEARDVKGDRPGVDFVTLHGEDYRSAYHRFAAALERPALNDEVYVWPIPSTGYEVASSEIQIVYFDPALRALALQTGSILQEYANNRVCITHGDSARKQGLGELNVYLPARLDLDRLAGGPGDQRPTITACQEVRDRNTAPSTAPLTAETSAP